jgi:hypothetical protein
MLRDIFAVSEQASLDNLFFLVFHKVLKRMVFGFMKLDLFRDFVFEVDKLCVQHNCGTFVSLAYAGFSLVLKSQKLRFDLCLKLKTIFQSEFCL